MDRHGDAEGRDREIVRSQPQRRDPISAEAAPALPIAPIQPAAIGRPKPPQCASVAGVVNSAEA